MLTNRRGGYNLKYFLAFWYFECKIDSFSWPDIYVQNDSSTTVARIFNLCLNIQIYCKTVKRLMTTVQTLKRFTQTDKTLNDWVQTSNWLIKTFNVLMQTLQRLMHKYNEGTSICCPSLLPSNLIRWLCHYIKKRNDFINQLLSKAWFKGQPVI